MRKCYRGVQYSPDCLYLVLPYAASNEKSQAVDEGIGGQILAREQNQVKSNPYRLCGFLPSVVTKGPKPSIPQYVKDGKGLTRSTGRSLIFWPSGALRQVIHWRIYVATAQLDIYG